jgi:hypothetical protein
MRIVGQPYQFEVPLKLFFDPDTDSDDGDEAKATDASDEAAAAAGGTTQAVSLPRPPLGDTVAVAAGWSNMSTHGFLSRACVLDPRTNRLRKGVEVKGGPVQVGSHMGDFTSPGVVTVRALSPERLHAGLPPVPIDFFVYEGTPGVREGMLGNEQMALLGVEEPWRHSTRR